MTQKDSGLQPERTDLSWRRTAWAMLTPGLLCLRGWIHSGSPLYALSALLLFVASAGIFSRLLMQRHGLLSTLIVLCSTLLLSRMLIRLL